MSVGSREERKKREGGCVGIINTRLKVEKLKIDIGSAAFCPTHTHTHTHVYIYIYIK